MARQTNARPCFRLAVYALFCFAAPFRAEAAPSNPVISAKTLDGGELRVGAADGLVTIVNMWATWCAPCRAEMPALDGYYQAHRTQGLRMLAISLDDASKAQVVRTVAASFHFPVALARAARLPPAYRPSQLPVTLVFGRDGRLRFDSRKTPGLMTTAQLDRVVGPLLGEAGL